MKLLHTFIAIFHLWFCVGFQGEMNRAKNEGDALAPTGYEKKASNCLCGNKKRSFMNGAETEAKCAAKCSSTSWCQSFGLWHGALNAGRCVLFDGKCEDECPEESLVKDGYENQAFNRLFRGGECQDGSLVEPESERARQNHCGECHDGFELSGIACEEVGSVPVGYKEGPRNCRCGAPQLTYDHEQATAQDCAAQCSNFPWCSSFGFWHGPLTPGRCVLFNEECSDTCPVDDQLEDGFQNRVYNRLIEKVDGGNAETPQGYKKGPSNCICGRKKRTMFFDETCSVSSARVQKSACCGDQQCRTDDDKTLLWDKCSKECNEQAWCKSFGVWYGPRTPGRCVLMTGVCNDDNTCGKDLAKGFYNDVFKKQ